MKTRPPDLGLGPVLNPKLIAHRPPACLYITHNLRLLAAWAQVVDLVMQANYKLCEVEILPSEQAADLVSIRVLELLSAPQDMQVVPLWCKRCDWRGLSSEAGRNDGSQGFE